MVCLLFTDLSHGPSANGVPCLMVRLIVWLMVICSMYDGFLLFYFLPNDLLNFCLKVCLMLPFFLGCLLCCARTNNNEPTEHDKNEYDEDEDDVGCWEVEGNIGSLLHAVLFIPTKLTVPTKKYLKKYVSKAILAIGFFFW